MNQIETIRKTCIGKLKAEVLSRFTSVVTATKDTIPTPQHDVVRMMVLPIRFGDARGL